VLPSGISQAAHFGTLLHEARPQGCSRRLQTISVCHLGEILQRPDLAAHCNRLNAVSLQRSLLHFAQGAGQG